MQILGLVEVAVIYVYLVRPLLWVIAIGLVGLVFYRWTHNGH